MRTAPSPAGTDPTVTNSPRMNRAATLLRGLAFAAVALVPVIAFVVLLRPGNPLRGPRLPDPLPSPGAMAGDRGAGAFKEMSFQELNFRAPNEDRTAAEDLRFLEYAPAAIKSLDGQPIRIRGFMIPVEMQEKNLRRCVIVASQMNCCYGQTPRFCEYIVARISRDGVPVRTDEPLAFSGTLHVGDVVEPGGWTSFYTLDCTAVER
jgi:hypothetical protein